MQSGGFVESAPIVEIASAANSQMAQPVFHGGSRHVEHSGQTRGYGLIQVVFFADCMQPELGNEQAVGEVVRFLIQQLMLRRSEGSGIVVQMIHEQVSHHMRLDEADAVFGEVGVDEYFPD